MNASIERPLACFGVIADTHIPDRARDLHPQVLPIFRAAGVERILHAGDICSPAVLEALESVAPVTAVRGNRDWAFRKHLPWQTEIEAGGVSIAVLHGHGSWWDYLWDKWQFLAFGYNLERYIRLLVKPYPRARVIVFGHTHRAVSETRQGQLLFNPGSAGVDLPLSQPSVGLLRIFPEGQIQSEIIHLTGARLRSRRWLPEISG